MSPTMSGALPDIRVSRRLAVSRPACAGAVAAIAVSQRGRSRSAAHVVMTSQPRAVTIVILTALNAVSQPQLAGQVA